MSQINLPAWLAPDRNGKHRRMMTITDEEKNQLQELVYKHPVKLIAKAAGISVQGMHKKCRRFGIVKPHRNGWFSPPLTNSSGVVIARANAPADAPADAPEKVWRLELRFLKFRLSFGKVTA